jgi:hypothetical protein
MFRSHIDDGSSRGGLIGHVRAIVGYAAAGPIVAVGENVMDRTVAQR